MSNIFTAIVDRQTFENNEVELICSGDNTHIHVVVSPETARTFPTGSKVLLTLESGEDPDAS